MIHLSTDSDGDLWLIVTRRDGRVHGRNLGHLRTNAELALICVLIVGGMAWWVVG